MLIDQLRSMMVSRGLFSFAELRRMLEGVDKGGRGLLGFEDFRWSCKNAGLELKDVQYQILLECFGKERVSIDFPALLLSFMKFVSDERAQAIDEVC